MGYHECQVEPNRNAHSGAFPQPEGVTYIVPNDNEQRVCAYQAIDEIVPISKTILILLYVFIMGSAATSRLPNSWHHTEHEPSVNILQHKYCIVDSWISSFQYDPNYWITVLYLDGLSPWDISNMDISFDEHFRTLQDANVCSDECSNNSVDVANTAHEVSLTEYFPEHQSFSLAPRDFQEHHLINQQYQSLQESEDYHPNQIDAGQDSTLAYPGYWKSVETVHWRDTPTPPQRDTNKDLGTEIEFEQPLLVTQPQQPVDSPTNINEMISLIHGTTYWKCLRCDSGPYKRKNEAKRHCRSRHLDGVRCPLAGIPNGYGPSREFTRSDHIQKHWRREHDHLPRALLKPALLRLNLGRRSEDSVIKWLKGNKITEIRQASGPAVAPLTKSSRTHAKSVGSNMEHDAFVVYKANHQSNGDRQVGPVVAYNGIQKYGRSHQNIAMQHVHVSTSIGQRDHEAHNHAKYSISERQLMNHDSTPCKDSKTGDRKNSPQGFQNRYIDISQHSDVALPQ
ncbi:hypothetical protein EDC01DRAFT_635299 [Geopyxis carbonaria]|nr:hypothetical protein EDC01DRAFT_635299 [Geopyxis carbonaria]